MLGGKIIGFLGAGAITESLIRGMSDGGIVKATQLFVTNRTNQERLEYLHRQYGVRVSRDKADVIQAAHVLVLACKPKDAPVLMEEIGGLIRPEQVVLSLLAGVSTAFVESHVAAGVEVVRAMPNTSSQVGESATAIAMGQSAGIDAALICRSILGAVGTVTDVAEPFMDAVTGLSGSGPAYFYFMIEALIEAGKSVGLPEETARELAVQTIKGAARMLAETGEDPAVLRQKVTSPNGTTMAGLQVLNEAGFTQAVVRAVGRATQRSRELGAAAASPRTATG